MSKKTTENDLNFGQTPDYSLWFSATENDLNFGHSSIYNQMLMCMVASYR